ncbi:MAG: SRPBCC family protein [Proteobacteria bacterium]|nr:SRPBCC family protein [Pseudomonadota bacterium]
MPIHINQEVLIAAPRADVAAFVMDPANDPQWIAAVTSCHVVTDGEFAVGTEFKRISVFLRKHIEQVFRVTEYIPDKTLAFRALGGSIAMEVRYALADIEDDKTRTTVSIEGDPGRVFRLAGPLFVRLMKRTVRHDLLALSEILEGQISSAAS